MAVVGGGAVGLVLAHELAKAGASVDLFEAAERVGGLLRPCDHGPFVWDRFYHCIVPADRALLGLLDELGLGGDVRWERVGSSVFAGGELHPLRTPLDVLRYPGMRARDWARVGLLALHAKGLLAGPEADELTAPELLRSRCGERAFAALWEPLLRAKFGCAHERVAARFVLESLNRLRTAAGSFGTSGVNRLGYVAGGYGRVLERLEGVLAAAGVRIRSGARVDELRPSAAGCAVRAGGAWTEHDRVALTVGGTAAARLVGGAAATGEEPEQLGAVVGALVTRRAVCPSYLVYLADDRLSLTAVVGMSNLVRDGSFGEHHLTYLPRYMTADDPDWERDDEAWRRYFREQLARFAPDLAGDDVTRLGVARARAVQPLPTRDFAARVPPTWTDVPGVARVETAQCGGGPVHVDGAVARAREGAREILASLRARTNGGHR